MKIEHMELFKVPPRWVFLKLVTDEGVIGWGEPIVEGRPEATAAAVREMWPLLQGQDPQRIEHIFQTLHRGSFYRGGAVVTSAISGIEQACWDLKGRTLGVPVHQLIGGAVRDRIKVYQWVGGDYDMTPEETADRAAGLVDAGLRAMKMNATGPMGYVATYQDIDRAVKRVAAVRERVGADVDIAIDFHGRVHRAAAKPLLRELEPLRPLFVEEAVLPEHGLYFPELAASTTIPLATGERLITRWPFRDLLAAGGISVVQPDLSHCGGIWEGRKIAAMAESYDVAVAPHCPLGPITLAASLQLDAATPNFLIQEQSFGIHYNRGADVNDYVKDMAPFAITDGHMAVPTGPGLGIEVDEDVVRERSKGSHSFTQPLWTLDDGTIAEW